MKELNTAKGLDWSGTSYKSVLSSDESDDAVSISESVIPPLSGSPRHVHRRQDETLIVLSGEIEICIDGETTNAGPGTSTFIPCGIEHSFRVTGNEPCRHLIMLTAAHDCLRPC